MAILCEALKRGRESNYFPGFLGGLAGGFSAAGYLRTNPAILKIVSRLLSFECIDLYVRGGGCLRRHSARAYELKPFLPIPLEPSTRRHVRKEGFRCYLGNSEAK